MTKGKARWKAFEKLATKLKLIWAPHKLPGGTRKWSVKEGRFSFQANITPTILFVFSQDSSPVDKTVVREAWLMNQEEEREMTLRYSSDTGALAALAMTPDNWQGVSISGDDPWGHLSNGEPPSPQLQQFLDEWLPLFRRNCFLSGLPLECSAHEQLEWQLWLEERKRAYHQPGDMGFPCGGEL